MDRYAANGQITAVTATPGDSALGVIASALTRARVYYFACSAFGTPVADNMLEWLVRRFTADGTGTAVTPNKLDLGAPAAQLSAKQNYTAEPTYDAINVLQDLGIHQRSLVQWNAVPNRGEIVLPAVAGAGLGFTPIHASYISTANAVAHWEE